MNSQPTRLIAVSGEVIPERRRAPRQAACATARLRSTYGDETEVMLADISIHGCSIRSEASWLRSGSFVSIKLEEDPPLQAIVRWVRNGAAGLEFVHPLSSEHLEWRALTSGDSAP